MCCLGYSASHALDLRPLLFSCCCCCPSDLHSAAHMSLPLLVRKASLSKRAGVSGNVSERRVKSPESVSKALNGGRGEEPRERGSNRPIARLAANDVKVGRQRRRPLSYLNTKERRRATRGATPMESVNAWWRYHYLSAIKCVCNKPARHFTRAALRDTVVWNQYPLLNARNVFLCNTPQ